MKEGWEYKTLGEVVSFSRGLTYKKSDEVDYSTNVVLRSTNINVDNNSLNIDELKYLNENIEVEEEKLIKKGSILICMSNGSKKHLGKVALIEHDYKYAFGGFMGLLTPVIKINSKYLYYTLTTPKYKEYIKSLSEGANINNLKIKDIQKYIIPIFPLNEQRRIVSYLDSSFKSIDEIKDKALKSLTEAKALFQSALAEAMEPKEGWEEKTLGGIATEMYRGSGIKRDQITPIGFPCLRYGEIYTTYNYSFSECISHTNESIISPKKYFEKGDILFAITGESVEDIGKCIAYIGKEKCLLGGDIVAMKHNQYPQFLAYALSTKEAIRQKGLGKVKLKVVHTNIPALKTIIIYLPDIPTQKRIVSRLDSLSSKVRAIEEKYQRIVAECDAMKQAMLREVFE